MSPGHRQLLYIHVKQATHFLRWEVPIWASHFELVTAPDPSALLLSFGPDSIFEAAELPAARRYANLFPGFGCNPLRNAELRTRQLQVLSDSFAAVFINPGPLQLAYAELPNVVLYPFSVDAAAIPFRVSRASASAASAKRIAPTEATPAPPSKASLTRIGWSANELPATRQRRAPMRSGERERNMHSR